MTKYESKGRIDGEAYATAMAKRGLRGAEGHYTEKQMIEVSRNVAASIIVDICFEEVSRIEVFDRALAALRHRQGWGLPEVGDHHLRMIAERMSGVRVNEFRRLK